MTGKQEGPEHLQTGAESDDPLVEALLRLATQSPPIPVDRRQRVFEAYDQALRRRARSVRQRRRWFLAAAGLLLAGILFWQAPGDRRSDGVQGHAAAEAGPVATVEVLQGAVWADVASGSGPIEEGQELSSGSTLHTGEQGRVGLAVSGASLRLDLRTRVRLTGSRSFELLAGGIYLDTGLGAEKRSFSIETPQGLLTNRGTQFTLELRKETLEVRVREGAVELEGPKGKILPVLSGQKLRTVDGQSGRWNPVRSFGPDWDWATELAPHFDADGKSLEEYLSWLSRESGLSIRFAAPSLEESARAIRLRGSLKGLTPAQTLDFVLPASGLGYRPESGWITIEPRRPEGTP